MSDGSEKTTLIRKHDRVCLRRGHDDEATPVKIVWARPISGKGQEIAVLDEKKKEVLMVAGLDGLDPDSRKIAEQELERRYLIPKITRVIRAHASFGSRYWDVVTDRGRRRFVMKDPTKNVIWPGGDRVIIRDTLGNRFEIESLAALDDRSRNEADKVL